MTQELHTKPESQQKLMNLLQRPLISFVAIPVLVFAFYQGVIASDRFVSQAKLIVKEPDSSSTLDPSMALLTGFGVSSGSSDTELVKAYIHSNDMLQHLQTSLGLEAHYSSNDYDFVSRLESEASQEALQEFYEKHVNIVIDEKSQVITINVQAFERDFAHRVNQAIVERAEWYINEIGHKLAKEQLQFIQQEHQVVDERLRDTKAKLLAFQNRHNLLDPQAEGMAFQQITYTLEAEIAAKRTQLGLLRSSMSANAPLVVQTQTELDSLENQLRDQRARLTQGNGGNTALPEDEQNLSVSELLARFGEYKIDMELALNAYASSQVSLEKSRIEAYRQIKYLVTVESPTMPEEAAHPDELYNISLFFVVNILLFGIGRILLATVRELRR